MASAKSPTAPSNPSSQRLLTTDTAIDDALLRRHSEGDETAFVEIMDRFHGKIYNATLRFLRNHADAEEITQDTFVRAHRGLASFRGDSALSTWLFRIAINLARNRYWYFFRRRRQDTVSLDCALGDDGASTLTDLIADQTQNPAQETIANEFSALVDRCMARLDSKQREILTLRNILNRSYEEISATLRISDGTVKSRIARARQNLRALIAEACPEFAPDAALSEWFLPSRIEIG